MRWGEVEMIRGSEGQEGHTSDEPDCCLSLWSQGWRRLAASRAPSHWTATKGRCWVEVARAALPRHPCGDQSRRSLPVSTAPARGRPANARELAAGLGARGDGDGGAEGRQGCGTRRGGGGAAACEERAGSSGRGRGSRHWGRGVRGFGGGRAQPIGQRRLGFPSVDLAFIWQTMKGRKYPCGWRPQNGGIGFITRQDPTAERLKSL
jgi:hypothetical protein